MTLRSTHQIEALFKVYLEAVMLDWKARAELFDQHGLSENDRVLIKDLLTRSLDSALIRGAMGEQPPVEAPALEPGAIAGIYRIKRLLGRGGQGNVYEASHAHEPIDRPVAIKLPRWMASESFDGIRREAQALARLEHPAIARFLSVDRMADGRVFLVTEYVDGRPLPEALRGAPRRQVLITFATLCAALSHAHDQGVAHLDIKPSNVLVDGSGTPRILDFGLGLMLSRSQITAAIHGYSPSHAAPEQLNGIASASSDTYSLGLLLLQTLTNADRSTLPGQHAGLFDDSSGGRVLRRNLGPDIHAVLRRACAAKAEQRYPSIAQFGTDLQAVLNAEPVQARRWTWLYALTCLTRRRPWTTAAGAGLVMLLCVACIALMWQRGRLIDAELQARSDAERAKVGLSMLVSAMEAAEPEGTPEVTEAERALVERLRRSAASTRDPQIRATAELVVARVAFSTGDSGTALATLDEVIDLAAEQNLPALLADAWTVQLEILSELARYDEADATLARLQTLPGAYSSHWRALRAEGRRLIRTGQLDEGEAVLRYALAQADDDFGRISVMNHLGTVLHDRGRLDEALELFESQREELIAAHGDGTVPIAINGHNQAMTLFVLGRQSQALEVIREAQAIYVAKLGEDSLRHADALLLEGIILSEENPVRARECLSQAVIIYRAGYGEDHPKIAHTQYTLGHVLLAEGDAQGALNTFESAQAIARVRLSSDHPVSASIAQGLGAALLELERPQAALETLLAAMEAFEQINADPDIHKAIIQRDLSRAYRMLARFEESEAASRYAYEVAISTFPEANLERALYGLERAASLVQMGRTDEAQILFQHARHAVLESQERRVPPRVARFLEQIEAELDASARRR